MAKVQFAPRPKPKARANDQYGAGPYQTAVDTTGMSDEEKSTFTGMRGPGGGGTLGGGTDPFAGVKKWLGAIGKTLTAGRKK